MFAPRRKRSLLGLDITASSVKLIELSAHRGCYRVEAFAAEAIPPESVNDTTIIDAEAVGNAIRGAVRRSGSRTRDAAIGLSGDSAITRVIEMPRHLRGAELEDRVELEADRRIPFPMEEVSFDFDVVGPSSRHPDMQDVLIVAARTENVEQRQVALEAAGLVPRVVDIEAFAFEKGCRLLSHQMPDGGAGKVVAVVDCGAINTTFSVLDDLGVSYARNFAFGGNRLTEEIMRAYGLGFEAARRARECESLPDDYRTRVLAPFMNEMAEHVSRSLEIYRSSEGAPPEQLLICGGCANLHGVADAVARQVGISTANGDPLGEMQLARRAEAEGVRAAAPALLTACGLALRSFD